jgi:hypothetical protein
VNVVKASTVEIWDDAAMSQHFRSNPSDTLRFEGYVEFEKDTTVCGHDVKAGDIVYLKLSCYLAGPSEIHRQEDFVQRVQVNVSNREQLAAAIDTVTTRTRFAGGIHLDEHLRYDVLYGQSDIYNATDGKPLLKYGRKDGLFLLGGVGYQFSNVLNGMDFHGGISYVTKIRLRYELTGGATQMKMVAGSDHAGEDYWAYFTQASLGVQPFKIDRYDQWRLWVDAGARLCFYNTGWQGNIQSSGSSIAPVFGITGMYRPFASRFMVAFNVSGYMLPLVYTNNTSHRDWGIVATAKVYINLEKGFWKAKTKK